MNVFDLHCDTVSACLKQGKSLFQNDLQLDLQRGSSFFCWVQTFAFWIDDCDRGEAAWNSLLAQYQLFLQEKERFSDRLFLWDRKAVRPHVCNALMAVENGAAIAGKLNRIETLRQMGISMLTLTWNAENEIGGGADTDIGLTSFGKQAVKELEKNQILLDLSHASERCFWDCAEIAEKPFLATHSNAKAICPHRRNLTDAQIKQVISQKGLIGLNFYPVFITGEQHCTIEQLMPHIEHILSLGGEQSLCLGSDLTAQQCRTTWSR